MKFFALIAGATAVSAVGMDDLVKRQSAGQKVDLTPFQKNTFPLLSPEKAAAQASAAKATEQPIPVPSDAPGKSNGPNAKVNAAAACTNPSVRIEWRQMTSAQKQAYINANICLLKAPSKKGGGARNRYEDLVAVHQAKDPIIHNVGQFLPWHRYMLHAYETLLRNECGYTGPMSWWDETKDAGNFRNAPVFTGSPSFGNGPAKTSSGQGTCINGPFAAYSAHIGPGSSDTTHCISRAVDEGLSRSITQSFVNSCNSHTNYKDMQDCSFFGPHAYGHNAVGAVMSDVKASPSDPIFYMHHGFIDHNWRIWQNVDPNNRNYQIGGFTTQGGRTPTTLDYVLSSNGIIPDSTVRDNMYTMGGYLCYKYNY